MQQLLPPDAWNEFRQDDGRDRPFVTLGLFVDEVKQRRCDRTVWRGENAQRYIFAPDLPLPLDLFGVVRGYFDIDSDDIRIDRTGKSARLLERRNDPAMDAGDGHDNVIFPRRLIALRFYRLFQ